MTFDYEGNIEPYEPSQREIINELTAMAKERIKAKDEQRFKPLYQEPTTDNQRTCQIVPLKMSISIGETGTPTLVKYLRRPAAARMLRWTDGMSSMSGDDPQSKRRWARSSTSLLLNVTLAMTGTSAFLLWLAGP